MTSFGISIFGDKDIVAAFSHVGKELQDFSEPMRESQRIVDDSMNAQFRSSGSELGTPWATRKKPASHPLLQKTGKMKGSFFGISTKSTMRYGNSSHYYPYHQLGTRKMPSRKMIGIDAKRKELIFQAFTKYLNKISPHFSK